MCNTQISNPRISESLMKQVIFSYIFQYQRGLIIDVPNSHWLVDWKTGLKRALFCSRFHDDGFDGFDVLPAAKSLTHHGQLGQGRRAILDYGELLDNAFGPLVKLAWTPRSQTKGGGNSSKGGRYESGISDDVSICFLKILGISDDINGYYWYHLIWSAKLGIYLDISHSDHGIFLDLSLRLYGKHCQSLNLSLARVGYQSVR